MSAQVPELVIFDCDGVLVDSETPTNEVVVANLSRHGISLTLEACENQFVGTSDSFIRAWAEGMGHQLPKEWEREIHEEVYERLNKGVEVISGIPKLLATLRAVSIAYCVASNGERRKMQITLGQNDLLKHFEGRVYSAYEIGTAKPHPGLFLAAASAFGVQPGNCVVIEDSLSGVKAARAAGMKCLGYCPVKPNPLLANEGAILFSAMADVPALLKIPAVTG